jgi:aspartyl-tRNA(Asn)/glutamyl-tRNA(Gln) amidotransferase subunit A
MGADGIALREWGMTHSYDVVDSVVTSSSRSTSGTTVPSRHSATDGPGSSSMMPFNVAGYPATSVCSGLGAKGLSLARRLVGRPSHEAAVLRVADAVEKATPSHDRRPPAA